MAIVNKGSNYIRISNLNIDYKSNTYKVTLEIYASENIRNTEKSLIAEQSKLLERYTVLQGKGSSVYKDVEDVVREVKNSSEVKEILKASTSIDDVNIAITEMVNLGIENSHIAGRTKVEELELLEIQNKLDRLASNAIITNTIIMVVPFKDLGATVTDLRDMVYKFFETNPRYNYLWN